ncbi:MAG TPA: hypothetical protein PLL75_03230 [Candidatus Omnitrophota bacterium]|nr:hypothetical protein [Candidatus Omnitrophota bacterium]HPS36725.1 hypothetical protein [Candidatus Omnitrophota bacterium]
MKKFVFFLALLALAALLALGWFWGAPKETKEAFRSDMNQAQKILATLRRAQTAYRESQNATSFIDVSALKFAKKVVYSEGWNKLRLPPVDPQGNFNYLCSAAQDFCEAREVRDGILTGNRIRIVMSAGTYACFGGYKSVTTRGFNGEPLVVGCRE